MDMITVDAEDVYENLPTFEWEKYQRGFLGILNNSYNQSCNTGTKILGDMSEITTAFPGGSYREFLEFYREKYEGDIRRARAIARMHDNLIARVESVGGSLDSENAHKWSKRYIDSMIVNSYRGFMAEKTAIRYVAEEMDEDWSIAGPEYESKGIDGFIGDESVQVKPHTHTNLDINSFDADMLLVYRYIEDSDVFEIERLK